MWIRSSDIVWLCNCVKSVSSDLPVSSGASEGSLKQVSNASDLVMYVAKWCNLAVLSSKSPPLFLRNDSEILMSRSSACSHDKLLSRLCFRVFSWQIHFLLFSICFKFLSVTVSENRTTPRKRSMSLRPRRWQSDPVVFVSGTKSMTPEGVNG